MPFQAFRLRHRCSMQLARLSSNIEALSRNADQPQSDSPGRGPHLSKRPPVSSKGSGPECPREGLSRCESLLNVCPLFGLALPKAAIPLPASFSHSATGSRRIRLRPSKSGTSILESGSEKELAASRTSATCEWGGSTLRNSKHGTASFAAWTSRTPDS